MADLCEQCHRPKAQCGRHQQGMGFDAADCWREAYLRLHAVLSGIALSKSAARKAAQKALTVPR